MNAKELWRCDECGETHEYEEEAYDCCPPEVDLIYECGECGKTFDEKKDADLCCSDEVLENGEPISPDAYQQMIQQLEKAGQKRLIP